MFQEKCIVMA